MSEHDCDTGHFDRTICPEPCGMMHSFCSTCGKRADRCAHETTPPKRGRDGLRAAVETLAEASIRDGRGGTWVHDGWFDAILAEHPATGDEERYVTAVREGSPLPIYFTAPAVPDAGEGEGLAEVLMRAVFIPGPVRVDGNGAIVLTSSEARRAAGRMTDWLAAHVAKAKESAWDEGWEASQDYGRGGTPVPPNPYRADRIEGTR